MFKELREEYGCAGTIKEQLPTRTLLRKSPAGEQTHWILVPFIILLSKEEVKKVKIGDPEKMVELGWFSLDKLPTPLHPGFKKTIELYKNKLNK